MIEQVAITASLNARESRKELHFIAARMTLISAMLNFMVYGGMLKQYRNAYISTFMRLCICGEHRRHSERGELEKILSLIPPIAKPKILPQP